MSLMEKYNEAVETIEAIKKITNKFSKADKCFELETNIDRNPNINITIKYWDSSKNHSEDYFPEYNGIKFRINGSIEQEEAQKLCTEFYLALEKQPS